jgi:hypothetical protein
LGKRALGGYLPSRFRAGEPFDAGLASKGMEAGRKAMSAVLAAPVPPSPASVTAPPRVPASHPAD